ncbi:MAG TPA: permease-like cell division protein FtsX [Nitrospiria bacterium]|jgi:cell division transport system permease protein|nr:permease-like cell division protein FtsX [Nitrospiria bacterium]
MRQLRYFLKETLLNLRGNKSTTLISMATIAFTMMLFGVFLLVYFNLDALVGSLQQEIKVILYLRDGLPDKERAELEGKVREEPGVSSVVYVSKAAALENFRRSLEGQDILLKGLGDNPLPASLELTLEKAYQTSEAVQRLAQQFKGLNGVEDIQYGREWVDNVNAVLEAVRVGSAVIGLILGLAAVVIIAGTIGLTVWSRLEDIEVLQLIGATRAYIQMPFLMEGALMGLIGGVLAVGLLRGIFELAKNRLAEVGGFLGGPMNLMFLPVDWLLLFLAVGVGLGCTGSLVSIRRLL